MSCLPSWATDIPAARATTTPGVRAVTIAAIIRLAIFHARPAASRVWPKPCKFGTDIRVTDSAVALAGARRATTVVARVTTSGGLRQRGAEECSCRCSDEHKERPACSFPQERPPRSQPCDGLDGELDVDVHTLPLVASTPTAGGARVCCDAEDKRYSLSRYSRWSRLFTSPFARMTPSSSRR